MPVRLGYPFKGAVRFGKLDLSGQKTGQAHACPVIFPLPRRMLSYPTTQNRLPQPVSPLRFIEILPTGQPAEPLPDWTSRAQEISEMTAALYHSVGFLPPWIGYVALDHDTCVGCCGFKSPPRDGRVEIAYFTFPEHERLGYATQMARHLITIARAADPPVTVAAQTLPEENASVAILRKLDFTCIGEIQHPEDGTVWEWQLTRPSVPNSNTS